MLLKLSKKAKELSKNGLEFLNKHPIIRCCLLSLLLFLVSESMSRHSIIEPFSFLIESPLPFLINYLIILLTMSVAMLCPKEAFALTFMSLAWMILAFVNFLLLSFRTTPFSAIDFSLVITMFSFITVYLSVFQLILLGLGIIAFFVFVVFLWKKTRTVKIDYLKRGLFSIGVVLLLVLVILIGKKTGLVKKYYPNLAQAYDECGFAYGFSLSMFDMGIDEPPLYDENNIQDILKEIGYGQDIPPKNSPNIIIVQLESFFDVSRVSNLVLSEDPIPTFTYLKANYPHGLITVPTIGGGTVNVEFEILTGMNLEHFGPGEYPYKTVLKSQTCETPAYTLKEYGYTSHAIHNHTATFYNRDTVYSALGFDYFTPLELMCNVETTYLGWAKDKVLHDEIINSLNSTANRDFIFTVGLQPHGKYPTEELPTEHNIIVDLIDVIDHEKEAQYTYYVDQLKGTDNFIKSLIDTLSTYEEPTAVVFYGDHFPTIYLEEDKLLEGSKYQTDYVIWANYDLPQENKNLYSYQLMSHFFDTLGCNLGATTKLHQTLSTELNYQDKLEMLEYDMLYGDRILFGGVSPYLNTEIKYGVFDVYVTSIEIKNTNLIIHGNRFNEFTKVKINDSFVDTVYANDKCVIVENFDQEEATTFQLVQYTADRVELKASAEYHFSSFTE